MTESKFVIESGMQLLARLTKKPDIGNLYPVLFSSGLKNGDIIEISYESDTSWLLIDIISEAIIPNKINDGIDVLLFNTDGNLNCEMLVNVLKHKISNKFHEFCDQSRNIEEIFQDSLSKLHILEIFDANQFSITIHNIDNILMSHSNICLVIFNSLTAFYWSEQGFKITKMDLYVKNLLQIIKKMIKEYKTTCIYTRPQYFISSKDSDGQHSHNIMIDHQIILSNMNNNCKAYKVEVKSTEKDFFRCFTINDAAINWVTD